LTLVQIQFKSISNLQFFNLKSCSKFKKKIEFILQPPWLSAHFCLSIGSHLRLPSAPTSVFHRHRRPSGRARRAKPKHRHAAFTSPTESAPSHLLFSL
jgi:hypothetical protein